MKGFFLPFLPLTGNKYAYKKRYVENLYTFDK